MMLPISHTLQVTSFGGSATTSLIDWLISNNMNIGTDMTWKHMLYPPSDNLYIIPKNYKPLYIVGDPVSSVISIFRRQIPYAHGINMGSKYIMRGWKIQDYLSKGDDCFNINKQLRAWTTPQKSYKILSVKYKSIWTHSQDICDFFGVPNTVRKSFPQYRQRQSESHRFYRFENELTELYKDAIEYIDSLPSCVII